MAKTRNIKKTPVKRKSRTKRKTPPKPAKRKTPANRKSRKTPTKRAKRKSRKTPAKRAKRKSRKTSVKRAKRKPSAKLTGSFYKDVDLVRPTRVYDTTASQRLILSKIQKIDTNNQSKPFFLSVPDKHELQNIIYKIVGKNHNQCFNDTKGAVNNLANKIHVESYISKGSFGRVFIGCFPITVKTSHGAKCASDSLRVAVKTYEVYPNEMKTVNNPLMNATHAAWKEIAVMNNMTNPLINNGYTPNLPFLYNWYFCDHCTPWYSKTDVAKRYHSGCMILLTELARSDMYGMFKTFMPKLINNDKVASFQYNKQYTECDDSSLFLLCSLFQVMNGLNAMQQYPQIIHRDIKAQNMLVHQLKPVPNEYIHYKVNDIDYWLPNIGTFAMIADFGLCESTNPMVPNIMKDQLSSSSKHVKPPYEKYLGRRPGVIMGPKGKEKLTLFEVTNPDIGEYGNDNVVFLKNWQGASDNFAISKAKHPDLHKLYGTTVLGQHDKKQIGTVEYGAIGKIINFEKGMLYDLNIKVTDQQKAYLKSQGITSDPANLDFYNHVQQIPVVDMAIDTQDVIRTFAGGHRAAFSYAHMSAPWTLGPLLSEKSVKILSELSKYVTVGPDSNATDLSIKNIFPKTGLECTILSDNPAHLLASYFIRDFKYFDMFKKKPPSTAKIIGSFVQPNGNGSINFK
jgi:serine/threonine protein kinase